MDNISPQGRTRTSNIRLNRPTFCHLNYLGKFMVVGLVGLEPTTSSSRTRRASKLRHSPSWWRGWEESNPNRLRGQNPASCHWTTSPRSVSEPERGIEPLASCLQDRCSAN